ncbi:MAG: DegV family protein [Anaerolineaceae bacterium]
MIKRCIVTDSSCLLPGKLDTTSLPVLEINLSPTDHQFIVVDDHASSGKPRIVKQFSTQRLLTPETEYLYQFFSRITDDYDDIFCVFLSSELSPLYERAVKAANACKGSHKIHIVDSQNTAVGLGILVKTAHHEYELNNNPDETETIIRARIPHTFTLLCTPDLVTLRANDLIDSSQAIIGEMIGFHSIFGIEEGLLTSLDKAKSPQLALDLFFEFISEFEKLEHIVFISPKDQQDYDLSILKEQASALFPTVPFCEIPANSSFSTLWGKKAFGIVVEE